MPRIFRPRANALTWMVMTLATLLLVALIVVAAAYYRSPYYTGVGHRPAQPVPFSHKHHAGELGLDCRYCHTGVEKSDFAGVPESEICMTCHSQLWSNAEMLAPVRDSLRRGQPLHWRRLHDLPDYVRFSHSAHVNHGVPCQACHGRVDREPLTTQRESLTMRFCLDCHRDPGPRLRPPEAVFQMGWAPHPEIDRTALGRNLLARYGTPSTERLTDCSLCHQ